MAETALEIVRGILNEAAKWGDGVQGMLVKLDYLHQIEAALAEAETIKKELAFLRALNPDVDVRFGEDYPIENLKNAYWKEYQPPAPDDAE